MNISLEVILAKSYTVPSHLADFLLFQYLILIFGSLSDTIILRGAKSINWIFLFQYGEPGPFSKEDICSAVLCRWRHLPHLYILRAQLLYMHSKWLLVHNDNETKSSLRIKIQSLFISLLFKYSLIKYSLARNFEKTLKL